MGYDTTFNGSLKFNKPVTDELKAYINWFSNIRHMRRDVNKIKELYPDWKNQCYKGNLGVDGAYFIGSTGFMALNNDDSIIDYNKPPRCQPGLWCQWIINDAEELEWDGGEKFYNYVEWLEYFIENFFEPEGYVLNGTIEFQGEDEDDFGTIIVKCNNVTVEYGIHVMNLGEIDDDTLINELCSRGYIVS